MPYPRIFLIVMIVNTTMLWFMGDFNWYIWNFDGTRQFKGFGGPLERTIGSITGGFVSAASCAIAFFFLVELISWIRRLAIVTKLIGAKEARAGRKRLILACIGLFALAVIVNTVLLGKAGDFNTYDNTGPYRQFIRFPSPVERGRGSLIGGSASAAACAIAFGLVELIWRSRSPSEN